MGKVSFNAHGHEWKPMAGARIATLLQEGFDNSAVELNVVSATVEWEDSAKEEVAKEERHLPLAVIAIVAIATAILCVMLGSAAWLLKRRAQSIATQACARVENGADKGNDNTDADSASTGTGSFSDAASLTDSEKDPSTDSTADPEQIGQVMAV